MAEFYEVHRSFPFLLLRSLNDGSVAPACVQLMTPFQEHPDMDSQLAMLWRSFSAKRKSTRSWYLFLKVRPQHLFVFCGDGCRTPLDFAPSKDELAHYPLLENVPLRSLQVSLEHSPLLHIVVGDFQCG